MIHRTFLRLEHAIFCGVCGFLLAIAVTTDYHRVVDYLFSDEAVYYMMAQSLAYDRDMAYSLQDLERVYADGWYAGPQGVYLTKTPDGVIYYGKYLVYSLFLTPFIAVFGLKGFLLLNMILLCGMIWMGWRYLQQFNPQPLSLLTALTFFLLSASFVYTFWLTPETLSMFCVTAGLFLWLYRREDRLTEASEYRQWVAQAQFHANARKKPRSVTDSLLIPPQSRLSLLARGFIYLSTFLKWVIQSPQGHLYLAPIPIAIACASKITNVLYLFPLLAELLLTSFSNRSHTRTPRRSMIFRCLSVVGKILVICGVFVSVVGIFFGLQYLLTGNVNQYAGDRRMFIRSFPLMTTDAWSRGIQHTNDVYWSESFFLTPKTLLYNIYYYLFGRFTGMLPYFGCSFLALYYFGRHLLTRIVSPFGKLVLWRRLALLVAIVAHIGGFIVIAPINYHGGSGAFGNRFFLNIYPAFLFLITTIVPRDKTRRIPVAFVLTWIVGALFLAQALLNPFQTSYTPAAPAFEFPYRFLPVELTMINALPTHVNPHLMQVASDATPPYRLYFMDENMADLHPREFWLKGERTTEFVVLTDQPQSHLVLTVTNGPVPNQVDLSVSGTHRSIRFTAPNETIRLVFPLTWSMPYFDASLYPVKIRSQTGFVPKFNKDIALKDLRYLGCRVRISFDPLEAAAVYLENHQSQEALQLLKQVVAMRPDDAYPWYALGAAYQQLGDNNAALAALERCQQLLPVQGADLAEMLRPLTTVYEAEDLLRATGQVVEQPGASNGKVVVYDPITDVSEFLVYGPYVEFPAGAYQLRFRMKIDKPLAAQASSPGTALFFDVYSQKQGTFLKRDQVCVAAGADEQEATYREYTLNFDIPSPTTLEFRVETTGYARVAVDRIVIYPRLPLRLYRAFAEVKAGLGDDEEAYQYWRQVVEIDPWSPDIQTEFLQLLLTLQKWDEALQWLQHNGELSDMHTGLATDLDPQRFPLAKNLPDALVRFRDTVYERFAPQTPLAYKFGDALALIGYDIPTDKLVPGGQFAINYDWQALQPIRENYAIFVHFLKQTKGLSPEITSKIKRLLRRPVTDLFQHDHLPVNGAYPTTKWLAHERVRERYLVRIPPEIEPGIYEIWIGVWNPFTEVRLQSHGKTKVMIGELNINAAKAQNDTLGKLNRRKTLL